VFTVAIDPGHGGKDPGAVVSGTRESYLNMLISYATAWRFDSVTMTRDLDFYANLAQRATTVRGKADIVVSIHCNASTNSDLHGSEIYIYPANDHGKRRQLAQHIMAEMPSKLRADKIFQTDPQDWRYRAHNVVSAYDQLCVLVECGYMTNPHDLEYLSDHANIYNIGRAISDGVKKWTSL
jgi:N-acetylmuramoyl-L-alanine amidase